VDPMVILTINIVTEDILSGVISMMVILMLSIPMTICMAIHIYMNTHTFQNVILIAIVQEIQKDVVIVFFEEGAENVVRILFVDIKMGRGDHRGILEDRGDQGDHQGDHRGI
jgi:hypothetical protein